MLFGLRLQLRHQQRRLRHGAVAYRGSVPYSFGGMATERKRGAHAFSGLNGADYEAAHCAGRARRPARRRVAVPSVTSRRPRFAPKNYRFTPARECRLGKLRLALPARPAVCTLRSAWSRVEGPTGAGSSARRRTRRPARSCERRGVGELCLGEHRGEAIEHSLETQVEAVLEAVWIVGGAGVEDDAR